VTRRYEFYKYVGPYEIHTSDGPNTGTNEALCASVGADGVHGGAGSVTIYDANGVASTLECSAAKVVGEYIGAQNAAANVATPLTANGTNLVDGEVGVRYPDRPLDFGGSGGPYSIAFTGGTLPAADAGNEFALDATTGVLLGGTPNGTGTATFTIHATDLVEPAQPAVNATFNITVVAAVTVDDSIVIPEGTKDVTTSVNLTASGGATPCRWTVTPVTAGLQASVFGNTLSLTANASGAFDVQVTVEDSLGGSSTKTLTYTVSGVGLPTETPLTTATSTETATLTPTSTGTLPPPTATATATAIATATHTAAATATTATRSSVPTFTATQSPTHEIPSSPTSTVTPGGTSTPTQSDDNGCQLGPRDHHTAPWPLLIPLAVLAWRGTSRRRT